MQTKTKLFTCYTLQTSTPCYHLTSEKIKTTKCKLELIYTANKCYDAK